ncbi:MAG: dihydroorotate dehydrogenase electron transfer subunit [Candidatus Bipolaricaulota bacterium]
MLNDKPRVREISSVRCESPSVKTFHVYDPQSASSNPGQFVMVWIPDSGEIPLAISYAENGRIAFTVKRRGEITEELHEMSDGDNLGIRGPYGNGFSPPTGSNLLVGGGYGVAPLRYLYRSASNRARISIIQGASTADELLFLEELEPTSVSTDDGTRGHKGNVVRLLEDFLNEEEVDKIYTSGPEKMIYRIFQMCRDRELEMEASLERVMKCGVGLCGSCLIDGFRVCKDGPVVDLEQLQGLEEFGRWKRTPSGERGPL